MTTGNETNAGHTWGAPMTIKEAVQTDKENGDTWWYVVVVVPVSRPYAMSEL